jgi:hypothetical protein
LANASKTSKSRALWTGLIVLTFIGLGLGAWWWMSRPDKPPTLYEIF